MAFPSPAENYQDARLDLNALLVSNPSATFFIRNESTAIKGIEIGDILVIDRSLSPQNNCLALLVLNGEFLLRRLVQQNKTWELQSDLPKVEPIVWEESLNGEIWGIVKYCIHSF